MIINPFSHSAIGSPLDLDPVLWLDSSDTSTMWLDAGTTPIENGSGLYQWDDKSESATVATQTVSESRFVWNSSTYDLYADGINDYMTISPIVLSSSPSTMFWVIRNESTSPDFDVCGGCGHTSTANRWMYTDKESATGGFRTRYRSSSGINQLWGSAQYEANQRQIVCSVFAENAQYLELKINSGNIKSDSGSGSSGAATFNANSLGAINNGTATPSLGITLLNFNEVIWFNRVLSYKDINKIGIFLAEKWELPWTPA